MLAKGVIDPTSPTDRYDDDKGVNEIRDGDSAVASGSRDAKVAVEEASQD